MERLIAGYRRFRRDVFPGMESQFQGLTVGQTPHTFWIGCADSRINPALVTQSEPGDLFTVRNAGNIIPPAGHTAGAENSGIEYAVKVLAVKNIVVCGHSHCGAMGALLNPGTLAGLPHVADWLLHARQARKQAKAALRNLSPSDQVTHLARMNVRCQLEHLRTYGFVSESLEAGTLRIFGLMYHFETGDLDVYDEKKDAFVSLMEHDIPD